MILFEIVIGNNLDDTTKSIMVLSNDDLFIENKDTLSVIVGINSEYDFVKEVKRPNVIIHAWNESDFWELDNIKRIL